jgi:toluene monooxygenase system ferredoxin subunit
MSWKRVCGLADVAENSLKKFNVDGIDILIANYGDGFRALPPICPHMEEPLADTAVIARCVLTCTKHLWAWNLQTLDMQGETERPLKTYEVRQDGSDIFALIDHELVYEFAEEADDLDGDFFAQS